MLYGFLALQLTVLGAADAKTASQRARKATSPSTARGLAAPKEEILTFIHTKSPQVTVSIPNESKSPENVAYEFETFVLDLGKSSKEFARSWIIEKLMETKLHNPLVRASVLSVTNGLLARINRGRSPSAHIAAHNILAEDVAKVAGVPVEEKLVSQNSKGSDTSPIAIVMIERLNKSIETHFTLLEVHGVGLERSLTLANTLLALAGGMPLNTFSQTYAPLNPAMTGYNQLLNENFRLRSEIKMPKFTFTNAPQFNEFVQSVGQKVRYAAAVGHQAAIIQLPQVIEWIFSKAADVRFAYSLQNSGPIYILSSAAIRSWYIAVEADIGYRKNLSPELEKEIQRISVKYNLTLALADRVLSLIIGSGMVTGPQTWAIMTIVAVGGISKILWDYHDLIKKQFIKNNPVPTKVATAETAAKTPQYEGKGPNCSFVFRKMEPKKYDHFTSRVAGL